MVGQLRRDPLKMGRHRIGMMISSTVAVEELNAFILPGIFSFTDLFLMPLSEVHQYWLVGYFIVVLSSNCLFWRSICNFHR
jgi:hypothetical protein